MEAPSCGICGGDGRIGNAFGGTVTRCPACQGTGRKSEDTGMRDVTKTKASHHKKTATTTAAPPKPTWPQSTEGSKLAREVKAIPGIDDATMATVVRRILEHESTHDGCTDTFIKKMKKEFRAK